MAEKLTPQQALAVQNRGGKLLVSAAAGSGKTKVLVDRLMGYLTDTGNPANLDDFLIITYTKMAATELRGKIASKLSERIAQEPENRHLQRQMQRLFLTHISTVHGFCTEILREYAYQLDLSSDFRVADEEECAELREMVMKELLDEAYNRQENDSAFLAFVDSQGVGRNDNAIPDIIWQVYSSARCHLHPQGWLEECLENAKAQNVTDASETVWGRFLMDNLFSWLDDEIRVMERCAKEAGSVAGLEKQTANLQETIIGLKALRESKTWDEAVCRKEIPFGTLRFPSKNPAPELAEEIKAVRNALKAALEKKLKPFSDDSQQICKDLQSSSLAAEGLIGLVKQFDRDYSKAKRMRRILDFGDLEHKTLDLLYGRSRTGITAAAREISERFREVMVDEYQDSNAVQDAIFNALTDQRHNCFLVGDVKQSIYQFRLADPGIFLEKYNCYVPAENAKPGEGRKVLLSHNFRSGFEVIEAVNDVFTSCMRPEVGGLFYGEGEALREGVSHQPLPEAGTELYVLETEEDSLACEASFTAQRIHQMLSGNTLIRDGDGFRPVREEDIVILLRSPGSAGYEYQLALEARGIRCAMAGGLDLLQTQEVSAVRSLLQTIANPRQDIPLLGALASPIFGFTADELAAIRAKQKHGYFYEALCLCQSDKGKHFLETLAALRQTARMAPLSHLMEQVFTLTRVDSIYGAMIGGEARKANLQTFYRLACDYEKTALKTLDQFLEHLTALENSGLRTKESSTAGAVTIMSIHKSKGLEFPVVFLCNLSRRFNKDSLRSTVLCDKELGLGLSVADNEKRIRYSSVSKRAITVAQNASSVSEEMRVLYVAMTRARDRLIMLYSAKNPGAQIADISSRLPFDNGKLLCEEADCPGDWILTAAVQRMEAGSLHAIGGRPREIKVSDSPWKIQVVSVEPREQTGADLRQEQQESIPIPADYLQKALAFRYPYQQATSAPSKQTATGRKGRSRDEEAAEGTPEPKEIHRGWRKPSFREKTRDGRAYGNAFHSAMQFIRYENCDGIAGVQREMERMVSEGLLTQEQAELVDCAKIAAFFESNIGRKLTGGAQCLREFKFSILDSGANYGEGLENEEVLLQGVVDCALLEDDGMIIVDFKTDRVTPEQLPEAAQRYRLQLTTYADALSRIYEKPVKELLLYFFHCGQFEPIQ